MEAGPIVGEEDRVAGVGWVVLDAGVLAGDYGAEVGLFFEAGDVLSGFVGDAGNRVSVVEQLLRAVGDSVAPAEHAGALHSGRGAGMVHDLEHLAFNDAAYAIQIRAALALDLTGIFRFAAQPEDDSDQRQDEEAGQRRPVVPIRK